MRGVVLSLSLDAHPRVLGYHQSPTNTHNLIAVRHISQHHLKMKMMIFVSSCQRHNQCFVVVLIFGYLLRIFCFCASKKAFTVEEDLL
jgi:hypothetical protein